VLEGSEKAYGHHFCILAVIFKFENSNFGARSSEKRTFRSADENRASFLKHTMGTPLLILSLGGHITLHNSQPAWTHPDQEIWICADVSLYFDQHYPGFEVHDRTSGDILAIDTGHLSSPVSWHGSWYGNNASQNRLTGPVVP
jgi:hypothetical protein